MSAGEFDGRDFAVGTVRGVRSFDVDEFGRLRSVQYKDVWKPGENIAVCHNERPADGWKFDGGDASMGYGRYTYRHAETGAITDKPPMVPVKPEAHSVAGCSHGFYAYYDGSNDYRKDSRISAVVEGHGDVLIGTRGFRAEKARIVALCIPQEDAPEPAAPEEKLRWRDRAWFAIAVKSCASGGGIGWATNGAFHLFEPGWPLWLSVPWTAVGLTTAVGAWMIPVQFRPKTPKMFEIRSPSFSTFSDSTPLKPAQLVKIRRNYPDVPVFRSFKEMVAAFPPDRGLEPSPETDPNFWEASA